MLIAQLKSFFMVARIGSVTQAAKRLGLSQPTITAQIRALEEAYGVECSIAAGGGWPCRMQAWRCCPRSRRWSSRKRRSISSCATRDLRTGSLRIGATAPYYVLDIIGRFSARYPAIDVTVETGNSQEVLDALQEYRVDVASSSQKVDDPRLERMLLGEDPLVLVVHRSHALAARARVPVAALASCRLLMREAGSTTRIVTEQTLARAGVVPATPMEIGSRESIREAVIRGLGVSIIERHEVPSHPDLKMLDFEDSSAEMSEYLYFLRERREARLIDAFVAAARPGAQIVPD